LHLDRLKKISILKSVRGYNMKDTAKFNDALKRLSADEYDITQNCGTEPPFKNKYWDNHEPGIYVDIVSGELLFSSDDKFDSGTGWPSFTRPAVKESIVEKIDGAHAMVRTEVRSRTGNSHLGHVFDDGKREGSSQTGMRYCINSAALRFIPQAECTAVFAAGCFWGTEAYFRLLPGVLDVRVGYSGGSLKAPTYERVCTGKTGHAEAVKILFDPQKISYTDLLRHFFRMHDPTQENRQGNDVGTQYRSAVFFVDDRQKKETRDLIEVFTNTHTYDEPIVTDIVKFDAFYPAEEYHQQYLEKHPGGYCHVNLSLAKRPL